MNDFRKMHLSNSLRTQNTPIFQLRFKGVDTIWGVLCVVSVGRASVPDNFLWLYLFPRFALFNAVANCD